MHVESAAKLKESLKVKVCVLFTSERRALHHPDDGGLDLEQHSDVFKLLDRQVADVGGA